MSTMNRRSLLTLAGMGAISLPALAACRSEGPGGGGSADTLSINSFGGTFQKAMEDKVVATFEGSTDITVDVATAISTDALAKLKSSPENDPAFDVAYMDLGVIYQAISAGLLQKFDPEKIPSLKDVYPLAIDPEGYWIAELVSMSGIAYNTELVDQPPTSWADLWSSDLKGKIAISDVGGTVGYQFLVQAAAMNGGSENDIDPGFKAIRDLAPNIVSYYKTPDEMSKLLSSGQVAMGPWYADRLNGLKASGAPVDFVVPEEGAIGILSSMTITAGSTMVDEAHQYIDHQLSTKVNGEFTSVIGEGPVNMKVKMSQDFLADNAVPYGKEEINSLTMQDSKAIAENLPEWIDRWATDIVN